MSEGPYHTEFVCGAKIILFFCNGPDGVGRCQRSTFLLHHHHHILRTSIGLVITNAALLSLVDTNWVQYTWKIRRCRRTRWGDDSPWGDGLPPRRSTATALEGMVFPRGDAHPWRGWQPLRDGLPPRRSTALEGRTALDGMAFPRVDRQPLRGSTALEGWPSKCLQLRIRTKNVQKQTKNGPNFNEKTD